MIREEKEVKELLDRLAYWVLQMRIVNGIYLYDGNKLAEPFVKKLLNLLYDLELVDLNDETANMPGIDLADRKAGVAFQVSTRVDSDKVIGTLRKAIRHSLVDDYPNGIRFLVLNDGGRFEFGRIKPNSIVPSFDEVRDIIYLEDLAKQIRKIFATDEQKLLKVKDLIEKEIQYPVPRSEPTGTFVNQDKLLELISQGIHQHITDQPAASISFAQGFSPEYSLPVLTLISQRDETVENLLQLLKAASIVWISGSIGTGKTGLANLVGNRFAPNVFWIDLRDYPQDDFTAQIVRGLCFAIGVETQRGYKGTLARLTSQMPLDAVFIFNDFPNIAGKEKTKQEFSQLLQALVDGQGKVLVTSNYEPYSGLKASLGAQLVATPVPAFTDHETGEVLRFYGATESFIADNQSVVNSLTDGHALLINTACQYLQGNSWDLSDEAFMVMFKNNYGQQYTDEVYARIIDTAQDEETKALLYRMSAVIGSFTDEEIRVVGSVSPAIISTHERSQRLKGIWLQELDKDRFQLSPMIKRLPRNLPDALWNGVNVALGDHILSRKMLSQLDAGNVLLYYREGKNWGRLAIVLFKVLEESLKNPSLFFDWGFSFYWYYSPFPAEIPPFYQVMIRSLHLQLSMAEGKDTTFLAADLERLIGEDDADLVAHGYANMLLSSVYLTNDPVRSLRFYLTARKGLQELDRLFAGPQGTGNKLEYFIWTSFYSLRTKAQFQAWFALLREVKDEINIPEIEVVPNYVVAAHSLVNVAAIKDGEDPAAAVDTLKTICNLALDLGLPLIAVYAIRYLIAVLCHHDKNLQAAEMYVASYKDLIEAKPIYSYLVGEELGSQRFYAGKKEEAEELLSSVIDTVIPSTLFAGIEGYRIFAQLIAETDQERAHIYSLKALALVEGVTSVGKLLRVKIQGEAGISYWLIGDKVGAIRQLAAAYEMLLVNFAGTEEEQAAIVRLTHFANYIKGEIIDGMPPTKTENGGEYAVPTRGHFFHDNKSLLANGFYFEERKAMGTLIFEAVFSFIGDYGSARTWAMHGIEMFLSLPQSKYFPVLFKTLCYLIIDRQYIKAVNLYFEIERRLVLMRAQEQDGNVLEGQRQKLPVLSAPNDSALYELVIIPITLTIVHDIINRKSAAHAYEPQLSDLFTILSSAAITDQDSMQFAIRLMETILINGIQQDELQAILNAYQGAYHGQMTIIAYLLQSIQADAQQAARLQLAIVRILDTKQQPIEAFYKFEFVPFMVTFWTAKFEQHAAQVESRSFWYSNSIPYVESAPLHKKVKALLITVVHHLNIPLPSNIEDWLYS